MISSICESYTVERRPATGITSDTNNNNNNDGDINNNGIVIINNPEDGLTTEQSPKSGGKTNDDCEGVDLNELSLAGTKIPTICIPDPAIKWRNGQKPY